MSTSGWDPVLAVPISPDFDHVRGSLEATVSLVEYGDYECPFCGRAYPVVEQVIEAAGDALMFAYRHFPLTTIHPHARLAAEAAESAGVHGEFWPMHDLLFRDQQHLDVAALLARAVVLGLDATRFEADLVRHAHLPRVREHFLSGVHSGVAGTPTFFVNGARYEGPHDVPNLLAAVEQAAHVRA